jgi:uncharacterized membrane-anchored protein YhcB (DUF1043 family)
MKVRLTAQQRQKISNVQHKLKTGKIAWTQYHNELTEIYSESL